MISIIITAYNAEKTIEKCLNSILDTKYNDYEIIVINDGSTDNTEEVIQLFATDKIKYFSKPNTGVADSRNFGIEKANGDYITFVDSDDYVSNNYFENVNKYIEQGVDLIKRKGIIINELQEIINEKNSKTAKQIINKDDDQSNKETTNKDSSNITEKNISQSITKIDGATFDITNGEEAFNKLCFTDKYLDTLWSYIIKKSLFTDNNFKFEIGKYHEDFGLLPLLILKANKVVSTNDYVYYYVQSENSIMREKSLSKTIKKAQDVLYHYDNILKTIEKYNLSTFTKENVGIYLTNAILLKIKEFEKNIDNSLYVNNNSRPKSDIENQIAKDTLIMQCKKAKKWYISELKKRKIYKNIKARNLKQLIKKLILFIKINVTIHS